jgi:hypothetical protein
MLERFIALRKPGNLRESNVKLEMQVVQCGEAGAGRSEAGLAALLVTQCGDAEVECDGVKCGMRDVTMPTGVPLFFG